MLWNSQGLVDRLFCDYRSHSERRLGRQALGREGWEQLSSKRDQQDAQRWTDCLTACVFFPPALSSSHLLPLSLHVNSPHSLRVYSGILYAWMDLLLLSASPGLTLLHASSPAHHSPLNLASSELQKCLEFGAGRNLLSIWENGS